eukprot:6205891-Pleurochrysis_carterae.AAC.3
MTLRSHQSAVGHSTAEMQIKYGGTMLALRGDCDGGSNLTQVASVMRLPCVTQLRIQNAMQVVPQHILLVSSNLNEGVNQSYRWTRVKGPSSAHTRWQEIYSLQVSKD